MSASKLTVIGIGNPQGGIPIVSALAQYFGERPLEVCFYDPDSEFLDIYDRLARITFKYGKATHSLISTEDPEEALENADLVIFQPSRRSASKFAKQFGSKFNPPEDSLQFMVDRIFKLIPKGAKTLTLLEEDAAYPIGVYRLRGWPEPITEAAEALVLHQVNRYLREDEPIFEMLRPYEKTPFVAWLNDPSTAEFLSKKS